MNLVKETRPETEAWVPLNLKSMHSVPTGVIAAATVKDLYRRVAECHYPAAAVADWLTILGLFEGEKFAPEMGVKPIPAVELPCQVNALHTQEPLIIIARNQQGFTQLLQATDTANVNGSLVHQDLEGLVEQKDLTLLFPWRDLNWAEEYIRAAPHAFLAFTHPTPSSRNKAQAWSQNPDLAESTVVAHDFRYADSKKTFVMQFLMKAFPERLHGLHPQSVLHQAIQPKQGIQALYYKFPLGVFARSVEISQDVDKITPEFTSAEAHLPPEWATNPAGYLWWRMGNPKFSAPELQRLHQEFMLMEKYDFLNEMCILLEGKDYSDQHRIITMTSGSGTHSQVGYRIGLNPHSAMELWPGAFLSDDRPDRADVDVLVETDRRRQIQQYYLNAYPNQVDFMVTERTMGKDKVIQLAAQQHLPITETEAEAIGHEHIIYQIAQHPSALLFQKQNLPRIRLGQRLFLQATPTMVEYWRIPGKLDFLSSRELNLISKIQSLHPQLPPTLDLDDQRLVDEIFNVDHKIGIAYITSFMLNLIDRLQTVVHHPQPRHLIQLLAVSRPAVGKARNEYFDSWTKERPDFDPDSALDQALSITNGVMVFKDAIKLAKLELNHEHIPPERRHYIETMVKSTQDLYAFLTGHSQAVADIALWQTALELWYRPYYYAALFSGLAQGQYFQKYAAQLFVNQYFRRVGSFYFPDSWETLPSKTTVHNGSQVSLSQELLQWQSPHQAAENLMLVSYNDRLHNPRLKTVWDYMEYDFTHYGLSVGIDPIAQFPLSTRFNPNSSEIQTVIAYLSGARTIRNRRGEVQVLADFDSGGFFTASFLKARAAELLQPIAKPSYYRFRVQKNQRGSWDLI